MVKTINPKKKGKKKGKAKPQKRMPSVNSMRRAVENLLDKLDLKHAVVRDHRHLMIVTREDRAPFTVNLINGKVEDIDISKGVSDAKDATVVGDAARAGDDAVAS